MECPVCGLEKFFIDGICGICHYDAYEDREEGLTNAEDF